MASNESIVGSLLNGIEFDDPRLYQLLDYLSHDFYDLYNTIRPPSSVSVFGITGQILGPGSVLNFLGVTSGNNLKLSWDSVGSLLTYEIRYKIGAGTIADWATAVSILTTSTLSADINPISIPLTIGSHTFLIKAIDSNGIYSTVASASVVVISAISAPVITSKVISNNVLLYWTIPTSTFNVNYYNIYKDGVLQGRVQGTFEAVFEVTSGTYSYTVEAVDIVGNVGTLSAAVVSQVGSPTDFILYATLTSTFSGSKTQCKKELIGSTNYLLACVDITTDYDTHFSSPGWATPQAQVTAGYPYFIQPAKTTGSYVETFDFGVILSNIIVVVNWNQTPVVGTITVATTTLEYSTDGATWSAPATGTSTFATALRYVRLTMNFAGTSTALAYFSNLQCLLNVHRETDAGTGSAVSTDAGGTTVLFNKAFRSVDSINVTPRSTVSAYAVVNFTSVVNPTSFKVLVFDSAGARLSKDFDWIARGII